MEKSIQVQGGSQLNGEAVVPGAKNAVLKEMVACLLAPGEYTLSNAPNIKDVHYMSEVLSHLGLDISFSDKDLLIKTPKRLNIEAPYDLVKKMRASIIILGPLLAREGKVRIAFPGGDNLGPRPVQMHLDALEKMGATFSLEHGVLIGEARELQGVEINLPYASVGATENTILAGVLANGRTVIENAAREPEVTDLVLMLRSMGADIEGEGTSEIIVNGVDSLHSTDHSIIGDRIVAGTYLLATAAVGGTVLVKGIDPLHLDMEIKKMAEMGMRISTTEDSISLTSDTPPKGIDISTLPFPGVATDLQPMFSAALLKSSGTSIITENVYDQRFQWVPEVLRMGANVQIGWQHAVIKGVEELSGAPVVCPDIRTGAALLIASLSADGNSEIDGISHIERGYEDIVHSFSELGAKLEYN
ncbi:MAG: UDP-N-acetylglucosamine 1-carboxyvinyltransferase [Actinomycetota bacterium]|nr:UDP-N-acetylglucosamine 1-carboxyvinyltransferase [Actinomycetota bacterium]